MFIEMAKDALKSRDPEIVQQEADEFLSLGPRRLADIAELAGYLLGLETARVLLAAQPRAPRAGPPERL
jgi:hypothetical protein